MTATIDALTRARDIAKKRLGLAPDFALFQSIYAQLQYLLAVAEGVEKDRSRLRTIISGTYAVREFEVSHPELANALFEAQSIADKLERGDV